MSVINGLITKEQLVAIMPFAKDRADKFLPFLNAAMVEFNIISENASRKRLAAFLATIAHESGHLRYVKELASGAAYEGRIKDLGNRLPGDGIRYKGRSLIQITGRINYTKVMMALDIDCLEHPDLLELPENACRASAWWWYDQKLNELADTGDFLAVSIRVNGKNKNGLPNGWADRQELYERALNVLGES